MVDTGYLDAERLVTRQREYGVALVGPTRPDYRGQARAGQGFDASHFVIDWEQPQALCPMGQWGSRWTPVLDQQHNAVLKITCSERDGQACARRVDCTRATRRTISIRPHEQYLGLQAARHRERTAASQAEYAKRAGIEATISQAVRGFGVRRARYMGVAKTHLQHILTAAAINFVRIGTWLGGGRPAKTRPSSFASLMRQPVAVN